MFKNTHIENKLKQLIVMLIILGIVVIFTNMAMSLALFDTFEIQISFKSNRVLIGWQ